MNITYIFVSLHLLLSPSIGQASEKLAKHDAFGIWALREAFGEGAPWDILVLLSRELHDIPTHRVLITDGTHQEWVYLQDLASRNAHWDFVDPVQGLRTFQASTFFSESAMIWFLERKDRIREALLQEQSEKWEKNLEKMTARMQRQEGGTWNPRKAYGAGILASYMIDLSAIYAGALRASLCAATKTPLEWGEAMREAMTYAKSGALSAALSGVRVATYAIAGSAWEVAGSACAKPVWDIATDEVLPLLFKKLNGVPSNSVLADEIGTISYDLAELFIILWQLDNGHQSQKRIFDAAYDDFPLISRHMINAAFDEAIGKLELDDNIFIKAFKRRREELAAYVLPDELELESCQWSSASLPYCVVQ